MVGKCSHVVGASGKREGFTAANATSMATLVGGNHAKVFTKFFVTREVVEVCRCGPAMQQEKHRRIRWAREFAKENGAAAWKRYFTPWRKMWFFGRELSHEGT
jgi:hypothetical protein